MNEAPAGGDRTPVEGATAWPFLIGRGLRVGHSLLLVPGPMNRAEAMALLDEVAAPPAGTDSATSITSAGSYGVGYQARLIGREDIGIGADSGDGATGGEPLRDEHGRPIQVLYGFAVADRNVETVTSGDLAACWSQAVVTYRRFHGNEDGFQIQRSDPIAITSPTGARRPTSENEGPIQAASEVVESSDDRPGDSGRSKLLTERPYDRRTSRLPWWSLPGALFGLFAVIVVAVAIARSLDAGSTVFVEQSDPGCEIEASDEGCLFVVTSTSSEPLSVVAVVEPTTLASALEVEADEACDAVDLETPCQVRVTAENGPIETDGLDGPIRLVVSVEGSDVTASVDLR